ncbi:hypothetical protein DL98DRAFT_569772 [Cadophora sp. DSE1049]|nr:hypothetical protein DL98DRAFT_569772 [Cadophora sp. DSE1049]
MPYHMCGGSWPLQLNCWPLFMALVCFLPPAERKQSTYCGTGFTCTAQISMTRAGSGHKSGSFSTKQHRRDVSCQSSLVVVVKPAPPPPQHRTRGPSSESVKHGEVRNLAAVSLKFFGAVEEGPQQHVFALLDQGARYNVASVAPVESGLDGWRGPGPVDVVSLSDRGYAKQSADHERTLGKENGLRAEESQSESRFRDRTGDSACCVEVYHFFDIETLATCGMKSEKLNMSEISQPKNIQEVCRVGPFQFGLLRGLRRWLDERKIVAGGGQVTVSSLESMVQVFIENLVENRIACMNRLSSSDKRLFDLEAASSAGQAWRT